jgi:allophanate hydrolase
MIDPGFKPLTIADYQSAYREARQSMRETLISLWRTLDQNAVGPAGDTAWIYLPTQAQRESLLTALEKKNQADCPLWGVPFAVKDNIDIAGWPTTAACPAFQYLASQHATVVQALINAGAVPMGKTNLDQFATGLVGTRSPYGWVPNAFSAEHISGGSSSGSASVVARGLVCFSLGTDTAGSGRIPAGFNHLVGTKPTPGLVSTQGVVPACQTLDCVSILSLTTADASTVLESLVNHRHSVTKTEPQYHAPIFNQRFAFPKGLRVGVPAGAVFNDPHYAACFQEALESVKRLGITPIAIDMTPLDAIAAKLYAGPWVTERYLVARHIFDTNSTELDLTVKEIVSAGRAYSAADVFAAIYDIRQLAVQADAIWHEIDVLLVPTAPGLPKYQSVVDDPIGVNTSLGRYTNYVNLLGWAALATPSGFTPSGLPFGVTWIAPGGTDHALLALGHEWMQTQRLPLGLHLRKFSDLAPSVLTSPKDSHQIAVVGAHLSGMPLNGQLQAIGARLRVATTTSANYRLYALPNTKPPKPGLVRVKNDGQCIAIEVYDVPTWAVSGFLRDIASPLGLGSVELASGQWVTGFICEPVAVDEALDITSFGGWRAYMTQRIK